MDAPIVIPFDVWVVLVTFWVWIGIATAAFGFVAALIAVWAATKGVRDGSPR